MFVSPRSELSEFRKRYRWMRMFVVLTFMIFVGRLVQLQVFKGDDYNKESMNNVVRSVSLPSVRGMIFDSKGRVLATSIPSHTLVAIPHYLDMGKEFARLVELLELDEEQAEVIGARIAERRENPTDMRRFQQLTLLERLNPEQLATIKAHSEELPGIDVVDVPVRYYPYGSLASHVIGYQNEVNGDDIKRLNGKVEDGYRAGDRIGRNGVERMLEDSLRGVRGWQKKVVDARGLALSRQEAEDLLPGARIQEPRPGYDVTLTVDIGLQKIVEQSLRGHLSAASVVLDVNSGRVLAVASKPSIDPNMMTDGLSFAEHKALNENPYRPRIDKAIYENYFPGSVFKPFTAMAALEEGIITSDDILHCSGFHELGRRTFRCPRAHGDLDLHGALVVSCNVFFYNLAEMTGMDRIARFAREFGFGAKTGIGYNSEATGLIPTRAWYDEKFPGKFRIGHTLNAAIGQGNTKVTVMQVAAAYAAMANGGVLYKPQIVRRIETPDGDVVKEFHPEVRRRTAVSQGHLDLIMNALLGVVEEKDGTAHAARNASVLVAGKTGTAQVAKKSRSKSNSLAEHYYANRDHSWFASVSPADAPEIAVVVFIEHGGAGGEHAAPIGIEIARRYFEEIAPREEAPLIADRPVKKKKVRIPVEDNEPTTAATHRR